MANEVIIRVTMRDDTAGPRDVLRGGFGVTGRQAGEDFSKGVEDGVKAGGTKASQDGKQVGESFGKGMGDGAKPAAKKAGEDAADEATKAAKDKAKSSSGKDSGGGILGPLILAGAPAAGAAAGAALVAGVGVGLIGLGVTVATSNDKVKQQLQAFGGDLKNAAQGWGAEMAQPVGQAIGTLQTGFSQLRPMISQALGNTAPDIKILAQGLSDLGTQAMPGVVSASSKLIPVFEGVSGAARTIGQATGQAAADVAQHNTTIGTSISYVGQVVASLEATAAPLLGDLSDVFAHTGGTLVTTLHTVGSTIDSVAHTALPALGGGIQADLGVINALVGALGPASSLLGVFGGTAMSAYMNVSLLGKLQSPISNAADSLDKMGTKGTTFGDVTSKMSSGLKKVGDSLPYVGVGLALIGTAMDLDAQHANDLNDASDKLAAGLEQGGAAAAKAREDMAAARKANDEYVKSLNDLNTTQKAGLQDSSQYGLQAGSNATQIGELSQKVDDNKQVADDALKKYNDWAAKMGLTAITAMQLSGQVDILSMSSQSASSNTSQLKADIDILNTAASSADQKIKALSDSLAILGDHGLQKAQDYAAQFGNALNTFSTQMDNAKGAVFNLNGELNTNSERGRDVLTVLEQAQQSWAGQAQSMADAGQSTAAINQALQGNQDQLRGVLRAAGLTQGQIDTLMATYGLIPKDISTKVHADTSGAMDATNSLIRYINGQRAVVHVDAVTGNTTSVNFGRVSMNASGGALGGAATGMALPGGMRIVGEQGAEVIRESVGATVVPRSGVDKAITDALGGPSRAQGMGRLVVDAAPNAVSQFLAEMIKNYVRVVGGGNVQTAFGRNS